MSRHPAARLQGAALPNDGTIRDEGIGWAAAARAGRLREHLAGNLSRFERQTVSEAGLKSAAVAILVAATGEDGAAFFLTRRTPGLRSHAGQWALPGGRVNSGESLEEAALRELFEEVGLVAESGAVLGLLDDYPTRSGYRITPVVVWAGSEPQFTLNPAEVHSLHEIPFSHLEHPGSPEFVAIPESDRLVVRLHLGDSRIHAPTAAILYQFREVALHARPTRVAELEQPVWAWR